MNAALSAGRAPLGHHARRAAALAWVFLAVILRADLLPYPAPGGLEASPHYRVEIEQADRRETVFVHHSPARWRTNASRDVVWAPFAFSGSVRVRVTNLTGDVFGDITDVTLRNVSIDGPLARPSIIRSFEATGRFARITFENLHVGGQWVTSAEDGGFAIDAGTVTDVRFVRRGPAP